MGSITTAITLIQWSFTQSRSFDSRLCVVLLLGRVPIANEASDRAVASPTAPLPVLDGGDGVTRHGGEASNTGAARVGGSHVAWVPARPE